MKKYLITAAVVVVTMAIVNRVEPVSNVVYNK